MELFFEYPVEKDIKDGVQPFFNIKFPLLPEQRDLKSFQGCLNCKCSIFAVFDIEDFLPCTVIEISAAELPAPHGRIFHVYPQ